MDTRHSCTTLVCRLPALMIAIAIVTAGCASPTPVVIQQIITQPPQVQTQIVETTRIVQTTQLVPATQLVQTVVTATPVPPKIGNGNSLTIGITSGSGPLSPFFCIGGYCYSPLGTLLLGLTTHDDKGQPVPSLATSWEPNATGDVWTFHLNPKAVWSDGTPLTANDVAWTYETCLDPATGCTMTRHAQLLLIKGAKTYKGGAGNHIDGITVVDDHTVKFTLEAPDSTFVNEMWQGIVPEHALKDVPRAQLKTDPFNANGPTVVSGPMKFVMRQGDEFYQLAKNDKFWGTPSAFDSVIMKALDDTVSASQLESGEIEMGRIPASEAKRLSTMPQLNVVFSPVDLVYYWIVNTKKPYLKDPRIRQALMYAMNRKDVLQYTWEGNGTVGVPPFGPDWAVNPALNQYEYDKTKAKAMLDAAGWNWKQKLVIMVGPWPDNVKPAEDVQAQFADLGLNAEVRLISAAAWTSEQEGENWDIGMNGGFWSADPSLMAADWTCAGWNSKVTGWCNPTLDKLAAQGLATTDAAQRKGIYAQISQILNTDVPLLPLYATGTPWAMNKGLQGAKLPTNWLFETWNFLDWHR